MAMTIDINCDMGESFGRYELGADADLMPFISSCNIAAGFHAGDPLVLQQTIQLALSHAVKIGAHPAFPDLSGFGRRRMDIPAKDLQAIIQYQIAAVKGLVELQGGTLHHVKPHGALYNLASADRATAEVVVGAIAEFSNDLYLYAPPASAMAQAATAAGLSLCREAFADRAYLDSYRLQSRREAGAVLHDPEQVFEQVREIVLGQRIRAVDGQWHALTADTICIHGDNSQALAIAQYLKSQLQKENIQIA